MWESKWMILCFFDTNALYLPDVLDLKLQAIFLTGICCILPLLVWVGDQDLGISWRRWFIKSCGQVPVACLHSCIHVCTYCIGQRFILDVPQSLLQHFKIFIDWTCWLTISYMFITCGLLLASILSYLLLAPSSPSSLQSLSHIHVLFLFCDPLTWIRNVCVSVWSLI